MLFEFPKAVAVDCYHHIFQSFSLRCLLAQELQNVNMDEYVKLLDDVRQVNLDEFDVEPAMEGTISFLSACPNNKGESTHGLFLSCVVSVWVT